MDDSSRDYDNTEGQSLFLQGDDNMDGSDVNIENFVSFTDSAFHRSFVEPPHYKHLFDAVPDAIFIADAETGIILDTNTTAAKLLGRAVDRIVGRHQSQLHPAGDQQRYRDIFRRHTQDGAGCIVEDGYVQHSSGRLIPVQINATITRLGRKKIVFGIFRDMTEQKRLRDELQLSEKRFSAIFENAAEGILVANVEDQTFVYVNPAIADMLGYSQGELLRLTVADIHPGELLDRVREDFKKIAQGQKITVQHRCLTKDGRVIDVEIKGSNVPFSDKKCICGFFREITEQKRLLEDLKTSERRLKRLAETSFEAIVIHKDGVLIEGNQKLFEMFGYTEEEFRRINGLEALAPESSALAKTKMAEQNSGPYEVLGLKKDGTAFPIEISAKTDTVDGQNVRVAAIRDLTAQKAMEQKLLDREKQYRELYRNARVALYRNSIEESLLLECNDAYAVQLGYENREHCLAECKHTISQYANPDQRAEFLKKLKKAGVLYNYEVELVRRDGRHIWVEASVKMYPEEGYIEGAHFDITATKVLTKTQITILGLILRGKCNKEIAKHLKRSVRTIEDHRANIMQKLHADNIVELIQKTQFCRFAHQK